MRSKRAAIGFGASLLAAVLAAGGCAADGDDLVGVPEEPTTVASSPTTIESDEEVTPGSPGVETTDAPKTITSSPGYAANPQGKEQTLGPFRSGPLRFDQVAIGKGAGGRFSGRANVTNRSSRYLNDIEFRWEILSSSAVIDSGIAQWPSLAPGETVTVELEGHADHRPDWTDLRFRYVR